MTVNPEFVVSVVPVEKTGRKMAVKKKIDNMIDNVPQTEKTSQQASIGITKPLLAETLENPDDIIYPCLATPKIDGIRALRIGEDLVSRQFKPIRNETIRKILCYLLPPGSDGEIFVEGTFQDVTSTVMSVSKGKDFKGSFVYYWFDYVKEDPLTPYNERIEHMREYISQHPEVLAHPQAKIIPLYPVEIGNAEDLVIYETEQLKNAFEGVMIRKPSGKYKMGRSTLKEGILLKLKKFKDAEATVVGVEELYHNENEKEKNEFGKSKRSTKKEGLVPAGKLGSLQVINDAGEKFNIGTGFTDKLRQDLWDERDTLNGKTVKYKYFEVGSKNAPRFPTFLGFRDADDM